MTAREPHTILAYGARYVRAAVWALGPGKLDEKRTAILQKAKLYARNQGDINSAVLSAGFYAKRAGHTMYVYEGNSYMHQVWRVSDRPSDYLNAVNNTGSIIISITPQLELSLHDVLRPGAE